MRRHSPYQAPSTSVADRAGSGASAGSTPARSVVASPVTLVAGIAAAAVGVGTVATMIYFVLFSLRSERHSPSTG